MLICGIDPGLHRTGYGILRASGGTATVVEAGVISTSRNGALADRLGALARDLAHLLEEHRCEVVAVEALYSHYRHPRTAVLMGHARGVILSEASRAGIPVVAFSATKVKRSLTGNGHAGKAQIQAAIKRRLGLEMLPEPPDVADALAVGLCAIEERWLDRVVMR